MFKKGDLVEIVTRGMFGTSIAMVVDTEPLKCKLMNGRVFTITPANALYEVTEHVKQVFGDLF